MDDRVSSTTRDESERLVDELVEGFRIARAILARSRKERVSFAVAYERELKRILRDVEEITIPDLRGRLRVGLSRRGLDK